MQNHLRQSFKLQNYHKSGWIIWALSVFVLCLILASLELKSSYDHIVSNTKNDIVSLLQLTDNRLDSIYKESFLRIDNTLLKIQLAEEKHKLTKAFLNELMTKLNSENNFLITAITDESGKHITSSANLNSQIDLSDREYFKKLKSTPDLNSIVSEPIISKTHKKWAMVLARKIKNTNGTFKGMLLVTLPIERLTELLRSSLDKPGSSATLYTKEKNIITRWPYVENQIGKTVDVELPHSFSIHEFQEIKSPIDHQKKLVGKQYVLNNEWVLSLGITNDALYSQWWFKIYAYAGLFFLFLAVILILYYRQFQLEKMMEAQEEQLIYSAKLSSIGEMVGSIANEMNNPMAIIQLSSDMIKNEIVSQSPSDAKLQNLNRFIEKIDNSISRTHFIIKKIRKLSSDPDSEEFKKYDLKNICSAIIDLYKPKFQLKNIHFTFKEPITKATVKCQELVIQQAIMNLLNNAIDAVTDSTHSSDEPQWIKLEIVPGSQITELKITNSGPLIPEHIQKKMMELFFTTKSKNRSVGLGLPLAKRFMKDNGGELLFDAEADHTTFILKFPTAEII